MTQSPSTTVPAQISMIADDAPAASAAASAQREQSQDADESAPASASRVVETDPTDGRDPTDAVVVASTEILQSSAAETVAQSADDAPATVIGAEQVLQLSPSASRAANDVPKLLNQSQVFQTTQAGSLSQQVIGATDADGRFFLFSPSSSGGASAGANEQAAAVVSATGTADDIARNVPGLIPSVQFAQTQGGQQFYLMVPAGTQSASAQETTASAAATAVATTASAQAVQRAIAPRGGADQAANVSVTMKSPTVSRAMRDERRRSTHNEVERRRRDKINAWISELAKIIPDCQEDTSKQGQSKGGVLSKTVDYIHELQSANSRMAQMLQEHEQILIEKQVLKARLSDIEKENTILKTKLGEMGIEVVSQTQSVTTEVISASEQG